MIDVEIDPMWVSVDSLIPHSKNRNKHPEDQIKRLALLINELGFRVPIIVSTRSDMIVSGHGRLEAAKFLGLEKVPVIYQSFKTEDDEYAFLTSDNAIADWSHIDMAGVNYDLKDLGPDLDLDLLGFKDFKLDRFEKDDPNPQPDIEKPTQFSFKIRCSSIMEQSFLRNLFQVEDNAVSFKSFGDCLDLSLEP